MGLVRVAIGLAIAAVLGGCGQESGGPSEPAPATQAAAAPSDPKLARLYDQTCKACHTNPGSGAPQAGDTRAWQPRLAQGMPTLLDRTINGYKGMPPLGSCMDCNEAEFEALIRFMAGA
jgi:cytochrome c5